MHMTPQTSNPSVPDTRWQRYRLGLWFVGLALLGLLRSVPAFRDAPHSLMGWLWAGGSTVLLLLGVFLLWRERARGRA